MISLNSSEMISFSATTACKSSKSPARVTPETSSAALRVSVIVTTAATLAVIDREAPGLAEAMRRETAKNTPLAMLSRGICGVRKNTLIVNFPGSPKAVEECFAVIRPVLEHAVDQVRGKTAH